MSNQNRTSGHNDFGYSFDSNEQSRRSSNDRPDPSRSYRRSSNQNYTSRDTGRAPNTSAPRPSSRYQNAPRSSVRPVQRGRSPRVAQEGSQYRDFNRYTTRQPKKRSFKPLIIFLILLVAIGGGTFFYLNNRPYPVTINGATVEIKGKQTLESLVSEGYAQNNPGDLLAIDGSVLTAGQGEPYSVIVNDEEVKDFTREVKEKDVITYGRGLDITEPSEETSVPIPWEYRTAEGSGPIHAFLGAGIDGAQITTTGTISGITQESTKAPEDVVYTKYYPDTGDDKVIALTLDDGPWPDTTEEILGILDQYNVKVTFFTVGELVDQSDYNAGLVKRAFDAGHQICTHTYTHASGSGGGVDIGHMSDEEQIAEITKGQEANARATGAEASKVVRAPGGNYSDYSANLLRPYVSAEIGWDVDTNDWRLPGAEAIAQQMISAPSGSIILCHDGGGDRTQTVDALRIAIPALIDKGYTFITIDELLAYPPHES